MSQPRSGSAASRLKRAIEWLWRGEKLAQQEELSPKLDARSISFGKRAGLSADLAALALAPPQMLESSGEAVACELYRQSTYWSICALARVTELPPEGDPVAVWDVLALPFLERVARGPGQLASIQATLRAGSFAYFAELSEHDQRSASVALGKLAHSLLAELSKRPAPVRAIYRQRVALLALAFALLVSVALAAVGLWRQHDAKNDLANGKPWRISTNIGIGGCSSPQQQCPENKGYFFHTLTDDRSPWIEFDLGEEQQVSTVVVANRGDCCSERAIPLLVELSSNHRKWRNVAQRETDFSDWRATFPSQRTRWVRLRVPSPGTLHLDRVRIER